MVVFSFLICAQKVCVCVCVCVWGGGGGVGTGPTPTALHKGSVVVEKIKEAELRSRPAQFIYDRNYTRIGLQPRGHTASRHPVKKLRRLLRRRRKVRVFVLKVSGKDPFLFFLRIHNYFHNHDAEVETLP